MPEAGAAAAFVGAAPAPRAAGARAPLRAPLPPLAGVSAPSAPSGRALWPLATATAAAALVVGRARGRPRSRRVARPAVVSLKIQPATVKTAVPTEILNGAYGKEAGLAIGTMIQAMEVASLSSALQEEKRETSAIGLGGAELERIFIRRLEDGTQITVTHTAVMAVFGKALASAFPDDQICCEEDSQLLSRDEKFAATSARIIESAKVLEDQEEVAPGDAASWASACGSYATRTGGGPPPGRYWVLAPVDTLDTFRADKEYTISVALVVDGKPVFSVVGCPRTAFDHASRSMPLQSGVPIFYAAAGMGSWTQLLVEDPKAGKAKYRLRGKSIKLNVADKIKRGHDGLFDSLGSKQLRIVMPYHAREDIFNDASDVAKRLGSEFPRLDMSNSNIKYCQLARGEADLLWYMTTGLYEKETNEPVAHHVAGVLLAEEAGAQVADLDGKPIQWCGLKMSENRGIIVTDPSILMIEGVVNAVRDGTVTSIEEYDKRCEMRQEINNDMRKIFDTMGKLTSGDEKTIREAKERNLLDDENEFKNEKKGFESATKSIEKYLDDDRQMNELANDAIRSTKPMLGNRSPERT